MVRAARARSRPHLGRIRLQNVSHYSLACPAWAISPAFRNEKHDSAVAKAVNCANGFMDIGNRLDLAMTLYALKPAFQSLLRPLVARLAGAGATANGVTIAAALGSILVGVLATAIDDHRIFLLIPVWLLVRMALNAIDGMLAREHGQASRLGAMLNEIGDVVSDTAIYIPFAFIPAFAGSSAGLVVALVIGLAALSEFAGVLGPMIKASRRYDGPMGKSDRALVAGALAAWIGFGGPVADWAIYAAWIVAALLALTIANRMRAALREAALPERQP
jgi:CDP-diacylglycerol---glycerol-3-phosphate 3-phosphatidyltransferase